MFESIYSVINSSSDVNTLENDYYLMLIPNGIKVNINGVLIGPFDSPLLTPITTSPNNIQGVNGLIYFIGNKNFTENITPITVDNNIISDNEEFIISDNDEDIIWN
jgi:hypothetical protein